MLLTHVLERSHVNTFEKRLQQFELVLKKHDLISSDIAKVVGEAVPLKTLFFTCQVGNFTEMMKTFLFVDKKHYHVSHNNLFADEVSETSTQQKPTRVSITFKSYVEYLKVYLKVTIPVRWKQRAFSKAVIA